MKVISSELPGVLILEPRVFGDERGFFYESFNARSFEQATGRSCAFVQDNHSRSQRGVLRGLHYQLEQTQGKLVRVSAGEVYDVAVDIRRSSPTLGRWVGAVLSAENKRQLWIPAGFAHGIYVLSEWAEVIYKVSNFYAPEWERTLLWNDPDVGIRWPLLEDLEPLLSKKDRLGLPLAQAELFD